jgi:phosphotransferase system enzyme I (PtsI)
MVKDPELADRIEGLIKDELFSVDYAIQKAFESYIKLIENTANNTIRDRSMDITDTRNRLLQIVNEHTESFTVEEGAIIVAGKLSPREIIRLIKYDIAAIVMSCGGATSHAALIARSLGIPTIVGAKKADNVIKDGDIVAMDGQMGRLVVHPSKDTIRKIEERIEKARRREEKLLKIVGRDSRTSDGHTFTLRANIEFSEELERVKEVRAEGVGLLRSESIYLEKGTFENVRQQEVFYSSILEATDPNPVTIRLFDAGGDKIFESKQKEQNPFLGWRGIRMLLDKRDLLRDQLEAMLITAGKYPGRLKILVPMVSDCDEIAELRKEIDQIVRTMEKQGRPVDGEVPLGIMVEVPSVVSQLKYFMELADFVSIGTNDLTQYVLAVDRGNELIADRYNQRHPAVWDLINRVAKAGQEFGKTVTVCGELASDPISAACMLGMGIDDLSMSPASLPQVKKVLIENDYRKMQRLSSQVTSCQSARHVDELFEEWIKD